MCDDLNKRHIQDVLVKALIVEFNKNKLVCEAKQMHEKTRGVTDLDSVGIHLRVLVKWHNIGKRCALTGDIS